MAKKKDPARNGPAKSGSSKASCLLEEAKADPAWGSEGGSDKTVLWLAEELRDLRVRPEDVLARALIGERVACQVKPFDPLKALRKSSEALFSPSVLEALFDAAEVSLRPPLVTAWVKTDSGRIVPARHADKRPSAAHVLRAAVRILTTPDGSHKTISRGLRLAWFVTWEAGRIAREHPTCSQPASLAVRTVAKMERTTAAAVRKAIERGQKLAPNLDWPQRKARHR